MDLFLGKKEGEEYTLGYTFCNTISTSAKTEFPCKDGILERGMRAGSYVGPY